MKKSILGLLVFAIFCCFSCEKFDKLNGKKEVDKETSKDDKDKEAINIDELDICAFAEADYPTTDWEHIVYKDFEYDGDCIKHGAMKYWNATENIVVLAEYGWAEGWGVKVICSDGECKDLDTIEKCKFEIYDGEG